MERLFHFTTCNVKGNLGPSEEEAKNYYENANVKVDIIKGIQKWKVPYSGRYIIEASGASGLASCVKYKSGKGVIVSIKADLNKNDILYLLVGQQGIIPNDYWGDPGGGASFVAKEDPVKIQLITLKNTLFIGAYYWCKFSCLVLSVITDLSRSHSRRSQIWSVKSLSSTHLKLRRMHSTGRLGSMAS